jgi:NAD(P)-dependent dehydrogenase (short-subunit alcohol dehydrogenase family)
MAKELTRRYFATGITANAIAPGVVATNLGRYITGEMRDPDEPLGKGQKWPDAGAATQVYVATDPRLANVSGYYFEDCNPAELRGDYANDAALAEKLWQISAQLVQPFLGSQTS